MGFQPLRLTSCRRVAVGAGVLLLALSLAGCGGRESVPPPPSPGPVAAPPPAAAPTTPPPGSLELGGALPTVIPPAPVGPPNVALLLPLTGRAAGVGAAMRNAAELALFEIADDSFALSIHDTGSTPAGAAAAA